jgi:hypothetical protein
MITNSVDQTPWRGLQLLMLGLASYLGAIAFAYRHVSPRDAVIAAEMAALSPIMAMLLLLAFFRLWKSLLPRAAAWRHWAGLALLLSAAIGVAEAYLLYH